ncbi:hypothetical protein [Flagellimonas lutaonensis]|uniref:Lipocalin-like domain-containing protein n=1 Tax=Flagellimonas lutaonensis TaxID=516051 RepID=A0A0D5YPW8_9FLAO|nr:hypothetical protein [Allomuricauda lutaonensis]AKA33891.1 hypothetical protein VC82_202 [Allomuricauda lutaonensis]
MKKLLGLLFVMFILVAATEISNPHENQESSIEGTWELKSFYNYDGEGNIADTLPTTPGYRQIKMYYNGKVMWTRYVPQDSVEWFGYGSYEVTDSTLTERLEYMSASMRKIANDSMVWNMILVLEPNQYSQIFVDEEGNKINSENYIRID